MAVRDLFAERQIAPEIFSRIVKDNRIFDEVAEAFTHNDRGLRYLEGVKQWMAVDDPSKHAARIEIIGELLIRRFRFRSR
jgi:hypothetical protein